MFSWKGCSIDVFMIAVLGQNIGTSICNVAKIKTSNALEKTFGYTELQDNMHDKFALCVLYPNGLIVVLNYCKWSEDSQYTCTFRKFHWKFTGIMFQTYEIGGEVLKLLFPMQAIPCCFVATALQCTQC